MNFIGQVKKDLDILKKIIPQESTKIESLLTNISADIVKKKWFAN